MTQTRTVERAVEPCRSFDHVTTPLTLRRRSRAPRPVRPAIIAALAAEAATVVLLGAYLAALARRR